MRKDLRLGLAVGCVFLFAVLVYVLFFTGPASRRTTASKNPTAPGGAIASSNGNATDPAGPIASGTGSQAGQGYSGPGYTPLAGQSGAGLYADPTTRPAGDSIASRWSAPTGNGSDTALNGTGTGSGVTTGNPSGTGPEPVVPARTSDWSTLLTRGMSGADATAGASAGTGTENASDGFLSRPDTPAAGPRKYIVKPGDTLWAIARTEYGNAGYLNHIVRANPGIDPNRLRAGTPLVIPDKSEVVSASEHTTQAASSTPTTLDTATQYRVASGDNLSTISRKLYGTATRARKLYDANKDLIGPNPNALKLNMVLRLPEPPTATGTQVAPAGSALDVSPAVSDLR